jgi:hypothetical protein
MLNETGNQKQLHQCHLKYDSTYFDRCLQTLSSNKLLPSSESKSKVNTGMCVMDIEGGTAKKGALREQTEVSRTIYP